MIDPLFAVLSVLLITYGVVTGSRSDRQPRRPQQHRRRALRIPRQRPSTPQEIQR